MSDRAPPHLRCRPYNRAPGRASARRTRFRDGISLPCYLDRGHEFRSWPMGDTGRCPALAGAGLFGRHLYEPRDDDIHDPCDNQEVQDSAQDLSAISAATRQTRRPMWEQRAVVRQRSRGHRSSRRRSGTVGESLEHNVGPSQRLHMCLLSYQEHDDDKDVESVARLRDSLPHRSTI